MDYEKAYKESFEAAKGLHEAGNALTKKQMEIVFPQLAESEDERIRKDIINLIYWLKGNPSLCSQYYKDRYDDMLAYLEKQKEQGWNKKPCLTCQEYEKGHKQGYTEGCTAGYNKAMKEMEQKEPNYTKHNALFDKCVENCDPKTVEEVNKRVDDIMNMPELSAFEQALTNFIGYWEDDEEKWPSKFVKKHGKHILDMAREELQKEQKLYEPKNWPADKDNLTQEQKPADEQFPPLEGLDAIKAKYYDDGFKNGFDEGVESVKPAEWSEEDNIGWDEAFACVTKTERAAKDEGELQNAVTAEKWLKEIKFKYCVHPVKQEWSDEDEKMAYFVNQFLEYHESSDPTAKSCKKWFNNRFKSLHPQPKQEWSEDDEQWLESIIREYERRLSVDKDHAAVIQIKINFLKSIRPQSKIHYWTEEEIEPIISDYLAGREHYGGMLARLRCLKPKSYWKPSDEQMRALQRAVNKLAKSDVADSVRLSIMYDNLKKLM